MWKWIRWPDAGRRRTDEWLTLPHVLHEKGLSDECTVMWAVWWLLCVEICRQTQTKQKNDEIRSLHYTRFITSSTHCASGTAGFQRITTPRRWRGVMTPPKRRPVGVVTPDTHLAADGTLPRVFGAGRRRRRPLRRFDSDRCLRYVLGRRLRCVLGRRLRHVLRRRLRQARPHREVLGLVLFRLVYQRRQKLVDVDGHRLVQSESGNVIGWSRFAFWAGCFFFFVCFLLFHLSPRTVETSCCSVEAFHLAVSSSRFLTASE